MALPPLVVTGQQIGSAHINSIRNFLGTWGAPVDANGNNLTEVGTITVTDVVVTGSLNIDGEILADCRNHLNTLASTVNSESLGYYSQLADTNQILLEHVVVRVTAGGGHATVEQRLRRRVDVTNMGYVGWGSTPSAYVSMGTGSTEVLRVTSGGIAVAGSFNTSPGIIHILALDGINEGGELHLADATGSNYWLIDNFNQYFRLFRGGTGALFQINPSGRLEWNAVGTKYASDAAAGSAGLNAGQLYATPTGELRIKL